MRFFARPGEYEPCGIFSWGHLALIIVTIIGIKVALKKTVHKTKKEVKKIIKNIEDYNKNMSPENKLKLEILKMES